MNISVIGLGKLGSPLAAFLADKGHNVLGVDINRKFVKKINQAKAPVDEPGLDKLIKRMVGEGRLQATTNTRAAVLETEMTFIVVPTPSISTGEFSIKYIMQAAREAGFALGDKNTYHLVVITSTVMPGDCEAIKQRLEECSDRVCGPDFGLCYNPEFIALGSVLHDMENPDFVLIGRSDARAGNKLYRLYANTIYRSPSMDAAPAARPGLWDKDDRPPIYQTTLVNAEIAKLALNCFVTMKISFANMLGRICEDIPGADVDSVTNAIGFDTRIGPKYLKAGAPFGGPCFPRDNQAFQALMGPREFSLPQATVAENYKNLAHITNVALSYSEPGDTVGIYGMAYKHGTDVREESAGVMISNALQREDRRVVELDGDIERVDLAVLALPARNKDWAMFHLKAKVILDPWRSINPASIPDRATYVSLGVGT